MTNKSLFFVWLGGLVENLAQVDRGNGTERPHSVAEPPDTVHHFRSLAGTSCVTSVPERTLIVLKFGRFTHLEEAVTW